MFNKNKKIFIHIFLLINITLTSVLADESITLKVSQYLLNLNKFSCNFVQLNPDGSISEGKLIYSENKIKINYTKPTKITFISKKNKAMYFNEDLMEVHYFNPEKTAYDIFKLIFKLEELPLKSYDIIEETGLIKIDLFDLPNDEILNFNILLQNNPIELKKIRWSSQEGRSSFSIFNISTDIEINKDTFSMVHPLINN